MKPIIAIVGRPNVGKSTLFNRLIQRRLAIEEAVPGVTRDRIYADADWNGRTFTLVDTGGILADPEEELSRQVQRQAELAVAESDAVIFVVDARAGITPLDLDVAALLRRARKPVLLCANKVEALRIEDGIAEFYRLGLGDPIPVSAAHGMGTGELLDRTIATLPPPSPDEACADAIAVAVIGRPNVGKSSLVNALIGQERVIVADLPGTTRDAIDVPVERDGRRFLLIDTAGMRRRSRVEAPLERYSVLRSLRALDRCHVALVLIDARDGVTEQDKRISGYAHEAGKGQVLVVNKWDLMDRDAAAQREYERRLRADLPFVDYAPRLFVSAKTGQRVHRLFEAVLRVDAACRAEVATADLNRVIREAMAVAPPPASRRGKRLQVYYATQGGSRPPTFLLFCNDPQLVPDSYRRYLENQLREAFPLEGTPLRLVFKSR